MDGLFKYIKINNINPTLRIESETDEEDNELEEENQELKKTIENNNLKINKLINENKELKKNIELLNLEIHNLIDKNEELKNENNKHNLNNLKKTILSVIGVSSGLILCYLIKK